MSSPDFTPSQPPGGPGAQPLAQAGTDAEALGGEGSEAIEELEAIEWMLIRYVGQPIGACIPLTTPSLVVGRDPENGLCLPEHDVSRRHARLKVSSDLEYVELQDLGSTNGVFVNGQKVDANPHPVKVFAEDVIRVGGHAFKVKRMDPLERTYHQEVLAGTTLDPLTGLGNRQTVLQQLETQVELARRHNRPLSVLLVDLDWFKTVNETRGRQMGDRALERIGDMLLRRLRGSDPVGRLGGDEFLALLPGAPLAVAYTAAEDFRRALEELRMDVGEGVPLRITCSVGVAELRTQDHGGGPLLTRADAALFGAKAGGRNRANSAP